MSDVAIAPVEDIRSRIYTIRGKEVMLDRDLAELYGVETKVLNQAVKRNIERFPEDFRFQLTDEEKMELVTNCDRLDRLKHSSTNPYVFTEQGVSMLSAVLKSKIAVDVSVNIMRAFVAMRKLINSNVEIFRWLSTLEMKQLETDKKVDELFNALEAGEVKPKQGIFYEGQIFDAYKFVSDIFRSAKESIVIMDNYIDDSVLVHLTKRRKGVKVTILTRKISKALALDVKKFNEQYPPLEIKEISNVHDRFIIIDGKDIYHFGASLKDLGKKLFAFSKMEMGAAEMLVKMGGGG